MRSDHADLYDGVLEGTWMPGLVALSRRVDAAAIGITFRIPGKPVTQHWIGLDAAFNEAYVAHYHRLDPWMNEGAKHARLEEGTAYLGRQLAGPEVLAKNAVVQELHRSCGLGDLQGGLLVASDGCFVSLGMMRAVDAAPFDARDMAVVAQAIPHWQRALRIDALRAKAEASRACGVFWMDARGRVADLDETARALIEDDDGVRLSGGRLTLLRRAHDRELQAALARPVEKAFLTAARRTERRAYLISVTPSAAGVRVEVRDPDRSREPSVDALRSWFGVTRTEALLMMEIGRGRAPGELADERGVSITTIRTQLSRIFAKTQTKGQVELAALVERLSR